MKRIVILSVLLFTLFVNTTVATASSNHNHGKSARWTNAKLSEQIGKAGKAYHLSSSDIKWLKNAGNQIVFVKRAESHGKYWAKNGSCWGLFQFNGNWKQNAKDKLRHKKYHKYNVSNWRLCPQCATNRFVRVYKEGGKSAIARHWKATLYK